MERKWSSSAPDTTVDCPLELMDERNQSYSLHHYGYWTPEGDLVSESCNVMDRDQCAEMCSATKDCAAFSVTNGCGFCFLYWGEPDEYGPTANNTEIHVDLNECPYIRSNSAAASANKS